MISTHGAKRAINNDFYHTLGAQWWVADDHMIAFLRAESVIKLDYVQSVIGTAQGLRILDLGAGGGFISLPLAQAGHHVTAVDLSAPSLAVLQERALVSGLDITCVQADITQPLPVAGPFDVVLALDVLEHVAEPHRLIEQAAVLTAPGGVFIYHTLNQTFLCWLLYLQIAPRLVRHSPEHLHLYEYNIKPRWMKQWMQQAGFRPERPVGIHTPLFQKGVLELLLHRRLKSALRFDYCRTLQLGYLGYGVRQN